MTILLFLLLSLPGRTAPLPLVAAATDVDSAFADVTALASGDLDGDGDLDLVGGSATASALRWWRNDGTSWARRSVAIGAHPSGLRVVDLDLDGDQDLLSASSIDNQLQWWRNDGIGWAPVLIEAIDAVDALAVDFDRDGDFDIAAITTGGSLLWWRNDGASFSAQPAISGSLLNPVRIRAADLDHNGSIDLVVADEQSISPFFNNFGSWLAGSPATVPGGTPAPTDLVLRDLNLDGRADATRLDPTAARWWAWDPQSSGWSLPTEVDTSLSGAARLVSADLDLDGLPDLLGSARLGWPLTFWQNGGGSWAAFPHAGPSDADALQLADLDGDGDLDLITSSPTAGSVQWWRHDRVHREARFATPTPLSGALGASADLNDDGWPDLLSLEAGGVTLHLNQRDGSFSATALSGLPTAHDLAVIDFDGNGRRDLLIGTSNSISWWEDLNGDQSSWVEHPVASGLLDHHSVVIADLNRDGSPDIIDCDRLGGEVRWWQSSAQGFSWIPHTVATTSVPAQVRVGDLDGDGAPDVVGALRGDTSLSAWLSDGSAASFSELVIDSAVAGPTALTLADLDHDGDLDVVATLDASGDGVVAWWSQEAGLSFVRHDVLSGVDPSAIAARDLDADGDLDLIFAGSGGVRWAQNLDGTGLNWSIQLVTDGGVGALDVVDLDHDSRPDLIATTAAGVLGWWPNVGSSARLQTTDVAPLSDWADGQQGALLALSLGHRGRAGDADVELAQLQLAIQRQDGSPLPIADISAILASASLWADDGDGAFSPITDAPVPSLYTIDGDGLLSLSLNNHEPLATVAYGGAEPTLFVTLTLSASATTQPVASLQLTLADASADDASADIPVLTDFAPTASALVQLPDRDADDVTDASDNCPDDANPSQANGDSDSYGGACDCDDGDGAIFPGASEGVADGVDQDCDGLELCYQDLDGDSWGTSATVVSSDLICTDAGESLRSTDCDDLRVDYFPGQLWQPDCDNDGSFALPLLQSCAPPTSPCLDGLTPDGGWDHAQAGADCDDERADILPGASELPADGVDQNCDTDEWCYEDLDGDGFGTATLVLSDDLLCDALGESSLDSDCDDSLAGPNVYPGAEELIADGVDQDCDGNDICYIDLDLDGFGLSTTTLAPDCGASGVSFVPTDCDDDAPAVNPGASEITANEVDDDCDGNEDCYLDDDGDGFGISSLVSSPNTGCSDAGESLNALDCDDSAPAVNPAAEELPGSGVDDDCDGLELCFEDRDGDSFGTSVQLASADLACVSPGLSALASDCDDLRAASYPGAVERCDGLDGDCDGLPDALDPDLPDADADGVRVCDDCDDADPQRAPGLFDACGDGLDADCSGWDPPCDGLDGDGDGFCGAAFCSDGSLPGDCDDSDGAIHPNAAELCDGVDQDCDGEADEGLSSDEDGDGYSAVGSCGGSADDCNDLHGLVHPGGVELCNDLDDDCNGLTDEGLGVDADGDGALTVCYGHATPDCDDNNATVRPGAPELPGNGVDDDCDGLRDERDAGTDDDGDGWCEDPTSCDDGSQAGDCDDSNANISPVATESANGIDDDCDGVIDNFADVDADGDGATALGGDCDDADPEVRPGAIERCSGRDDDCDGYLADGEHDLDGDGVMACAGDCDDRDALVFPGRAEDCSDGRDNDCDGSVDLDHDLDGDGVSTCEGDCRDDDPAVFPGAPELCNGRDDDCDGLVDEPFDADGDGASRCDCPGPACDCDDSNALISPALPEYCGDGLDNDCDGSVDVDTDADGDGWGSCAGDCDDADPTLGPGAAERCNGRDDDCDGLVDEGTDVDGDGWSSCAGDCDDGDSDAWPDASEDCTNGSDDDCDGLIDNDDPDCLLSSADTAGAPSGLSGDTADSDSAAPTSDSGSLDTSGLTDTSGPLPPEGAGLPRGWFCASSGGRPTLWVLPLWLLLIWHRRKRLR